MPPLSPEDAARALVDQATFVNGGLLGFLAACAILPGLLLTLAEATRRHRNGVAWSLCAALGGAVTFIAATRLAERHEASEAVFVFAPLGFALLASFAPAIVLRGRPPVSRKRRWPVVPLGGEGFTTGRLVLEGDLLRLEHDGSTQEIRLKDLGAITARAATIVLFHGRGEAVRELQLLPVPEDGEDDLVLARAIAERIRRAARNRGNP
jgi:hypothetical protein